MLEQGISCTNHRQDAKPKLIHYGMMGTASSTILMALILKDTITVHGHSARDALLTYNQLSLPPLYLYLYVP